MNGLAERRHAGGETSLEQRAAYIKGLCEKAIEAAGQGSQRIFATLDYQRLAKYAGSEPIPYLVLPVEDFVSKIVKSGRNFNEMLAGFNRGKDKAVDMAIFDGEALEPEEMASAVSSAIAENRKHAEKGGPMVTLVTTDDILFQFYLAKKLNKMLRQAIK